MSYRSHRNRPRAADDGLPGPGQTAELPIAPASLRAAVKPGSVDAKARTFGVVFTTGADVVRYSWGGKFRERLALGKAVDLVRLKAGAPFLASHRGYDVDEVRGVVIDAAVDDKQGVATIRFPAPGVDARADMLFSKIEAGIVTGVSVGYSIERFEEIESDDEIPTFLATRWTPFEISAVPMPADLGAGYRSNRDGAEHYAARACAVQMRGLDEIPLTDAWIDQRTAHIHDTGIREAVIAEGRAMVKRGATTKEFIEMSTKRLADEDDKIQTRNHLVVGDDRNELARRAGIVNAIVHSVDPREALSSEGREFRGRTLVEMARICVEATGVRTAGMSRTEVVGTAMGFQQRAGGAHSTSDFPFLLADAAGKFLLRAYKEGMGGLIAIARPTTAPDFKTQKKLQLSEAPALLRVPEGAEITRGTVGESQESYALATFARIFSITRQAIYNDDRGAFERMPSQFGRAARDLERDLLTAALLSTTPMFDADPLFHVDHKNTGTGALGVPALSAARTAMRLQTHINGTLISVDPTYLIVPAALETLGEQILTELQVSSVSEANPFSRRLKLVVEPRLDADDPEIWYLAADSGQIDTLEICRLEGEEEPFFESKIDFDTDALSLKARHDCAAAAVDWRGLYMSDGQVVEP